MKVSWSNTIRFRSSGQLCQLVVAAYLMVFIAGPGLADDSLGASGKGMPVSEIIGSDGRMNLEQVRRTGYEGALDIAGFSVQIAPETGEPILTQLSGNDRDEERGWPGWFQCGMDDRIRAIAFYKGELVVGGIFDRAGDTDDVNGVARWDGSEWHSMGCGLHGASAEVHTMHVWITSGLHPDTLLVVGGVFATAGCGTPPATVNNVACWDGNSWEALGGGTNGGVFAGTTYDNGLVLGGAFTEASGSTANYIATWDGSDWGDLGAGADNFVHSLTIYDGDLYAGGEFTTMDNEDCSRIAMWDGEDWQEPDGGVSAPAGSDCATVHALLEYAGDLIVGGGFWKAGSSIVNYIASWNGSSWSALGTGLEANGPT